MIRNRRRRPGKSGPEKAAQLLMVMGEEGAAGVLKLLRSDEVQKIGMEMTHLSEMSTEDVNTVLTSFIEGCMSDGSINVEAGEYTKTVLTEALGEDSAASILEKITRGGNTRGLDALKWMEPQLIAGIIQNEHPQIQAIVISHLGAELAGEVLSFMAEDTVVELILRMAEMEPVDPIALEELNYALEKQVEGVVTKQSSEMGGIKNVANIFNTLDKGFEESLMGKINDMDTDVAGAIQEEMFVFEDLKKIPDKDFQKVLREVSTESLAMALKGADTEMVDKVLRNMSSRASDIFKEDMESLGPVRISEVEVAQKDVLTTTKKLADEDKIVLDDDEAEMVG